MRLTFPLLLLAILCSQTTLAADCEPATAAVLKTGSYAANSTTAYREMTYALQLRDQHKLTALQTFGAVIEIPAQQVVCLLEQMPEWTGRPIRLPGNNTPYWVRESALAKLDVPHNHTAGVSPHALPTAH